MITVDNADRRRLRDAIIAYINGTIKTFAFDDLNNECSDSNDKSVRLISRLLYQIYDDTVDHPISVSEATWGTMTRIVGFLDTDSVADEEVNNIHWPFRDEMKRNLHQANLGMANIFPYNPDFHALPVQSLFNRIPTVLGIGIVALVSVLSSLLIWALTN